MDQMVNEENLEKLKAIKVEEINREEFKCFQRELNLKERR